MLHLYTVSIDFDEHRCSQPLRTNVPTTKISALPTIGVDTLIGSASFCKAGSADWRVVHTVKVCRTNQPCKRRDLPPSR